MSIVHPVLLGLAILLGAEDRPSPLPAAEEPARLREMLRDRKHPRMQSQAALLLVQARSPEAEQIVRQGLKQTDSAEVFIALTAALRLCHDDRFADELLAALASSRPAVREAAAEALSVLADGAILRRLQALAEDAGAELLARQAAIYALGHSGRKPATAALIALLSAKEDAICQGAFDALTELTGQDLGTDAEAWQNWWDARKELPADRWLEERLAFQNVRGRRLEGELERTKNQLVQLHQQLFARLPAADRLGFVQSLGEHEDAVIRTLAVTWSVELLPAVDGVGQRALADLLLRLCGDGNLLVQRAAVLALGRAGDPRGFDRLRRLLKNGAVPVRAAAAHALAQLALARVPKVGSDTETEPRNPELLRQVVPLLQKALEDRALEVVVAAAEDLGSIGVSEAGPVLTGLLRHPSESVRLTAAQALERVADAKVLDGLLGALDDPALSVRFGIVGALGRVAQDGQPLTELQRASLITRLEELLLRDADAGVRSRAATVLGQIAPPAELSFLWRRVLSREDARVQEKAWEAMIEIVVRSTSFDLLRHWDRTLAEANQGARRLRLLSEVHDRWKRSDIARALVAPATELLVQAQLDQGKWAVAFPLVRDLLARSGSDADVERRLRWLLAVGDRAMIEGNKADALRAVREAQPFLPRTSGLASEFERLEKRAKP